MSHTPGPIACSLPLRDAATQAFEWRDLQTYALAWEPIDQGVAVTYPLAMADAVADLVAREAACCSWLHLSMTTDDGIVRLELCSDHPDAAPVIALLAGMESWGT